MIRYRFFACVLAGTLLLTACGKPKSSSEADSGNAPSSSDASAPQSGAPSSESAPAASPRAEAPPPKPAPPKPIVIPAGTVLTVRLQQPVGSKISKPGERFEAALSAPLTANDRVVVPAGTMAAGTITQAHPAGRFKGGATLDLALDTLTINGVPYKIQTKPVVQTSTGKGKRTAGMIGGGAGAGALIGGLAGAGKGAAIGALVGAGAGTAGAAFTGKRDITLPVESVVNFQLTQPLTLRTAK